MTLWLLLLACRADPGDPSYPDPFAESGSDTETDGYTEGPDPFTGEPRLSLGLFYEGEATDERIVDDVNAFYYIYSNTYSQYEDSDDFVEGYVSDVLVHAGGAWWGGGVTFNTAADLSEWTTMRLSMRSDSDAFADITVRMTGGDEAVLDAADYGWAADGQWHTLVLPTADFQSAGADMTAVTSPFVLVGEGAASAGDELRIDDLYFTQE